MLSDVAAVAKRDPLVIHSRMSALSQPILLPRNRRFRGNWPIAAGYEGTDVGLLFRNNDNNCCRVLTYREAYC